MAYIVRIGEEHFVKRTARFGAFYGRVVTTTNRYEARAWTKKKDAVRAAGALLSHRALSCLRRPHHKISTLYKKKPIPQGQVIIDLEERPE